MNDKLFTILCSIITFILSLVSSYIILKINYGRKLKEDKYNNFYKGFYIVWNKIHQGRAYDFSDLTYADQEEIVNFLVENYNYIPMNLRGAVYELKTNRLDNFANNNDENVKICNNSYGKIIDYMVKREQQHRGKFVNVKF